MTTRLTDLQQSVIQRLNFVGMEDFAERAMVAWRDGRRYPCVLTPAERATMEGAVLGSDFKNANAQATMSVPVVDRDMSACSQSC
jgi:hypothetical protein